MDASNKPHHIVGIGASAGGLNALQALFNKIPADTGMAFVILQHLSPDYVSLMPELLAKNTDMEIITADDGMEIRPNCVYLNHRKKNLKIVGNRLVLSDKEPGYHLNLPIDIFFSSMGEDYRDKSIAIVLSGTGSDGSRGIRVVKEEGGLVIVQEPSEAQFDGMPNAAIATNLVDYVARTERIVELLINVPEAGERRFTSDTDKEGSIQSYFGQVLDIISSHSGVDFLKYKENTLKRRLEKRMHLNELKSLREYATFLENNEEEQRALNDDFLIRVTQFFRDPAAFDVIRDVVIPKIAVRKKQSEVIRVWVTGCSTGEEVHSLAILLDDHIRANRLSLDFKIFASDVSDGALAFASRAVYPLNVLNEVSERYLDDYFIKSDDTVQIVQRIREKVVFSRHDLLSDPPFIKMDLVSCRNLLIYLNNESQQRIFSNFQFSLNTGGFLFLGISESLGDASSLFDVIDVKWKIFENITASKFLREGSGSSKSLLQTKRKRSIGDPSRMTNQSVQDQESQYHKYLSRRYSPALLFVDEAFNILFIMGAAGERLFHAEGVFDRNLMKLVSNETGVAIRSAVRKAKSTGKDVIVKGVKSHRKQEEVFDLKIHQPNNLAGNKPGYLIEFTEARPFIGEEDEVMLTQEISSSSKAYQSQLEEELAHIKEEMQNVIEELETSNEELQSSNEELMASNEELQSTNEELQSVNEELYTVNAELQEKNKQLSVLNDDVTNLLDNTQIATLFLNGELFIRKFTPALKKLFNLAESDIGRSLNSFTSAFDEDTRADIISDCRKVLSSLQSVERLVTDQLGNTYMQRVSPFISTMSRVDGVIVTFDNIGELIRTREELQAVERNYEELFHNMSEGFVQVKQVPSNGERSFQIHAVNDAFRAITKWSPSVEFEDDDWMKHLLTPEEGDWLSILNRVLETGESEVHISSGDVDGVEKFWKVSVFRHSVSDVGLSVSDITTIKQQERLLLRKEEELDHLQQLTSTGYWYYDPKTDEAVWSDQLFKILGLSDSQGAPTLAEQREIYSKESYDTLLKAVDKAIVEGKPYRVEMELVDENGKNKGWLLTQGRPLRDKDGKVTMLRGAALDITAQKEQEETLRTAKEKAEEASAHKNSFLANMSHEIRTPMTGVLGFVELLKLGSLSEEEQKEFLEIIEMNSKQLLHLIDDIIDVSKIESNQLAFNQEPVDLRNLFKGLKTNFDQLSKIKKKKVSFELDVPEPEDELVIQIDPARMRQVMDNLLMNALKFSHEGTVRFGYHVDGEQLCVHVKDEGIGIAPENIDEIFERFKQLSFVKASVQGGTGLGLAISRGIVESMGGKIWVESELGKGSTFRFKIPIKWADANETAPKEVAQRALPDLKGYTLLIADDEQMVRYFYQNLLAKSGAELLFAEDGEQTLQIIKNHERVHMALLDLRMPVKDGYEAMIEIKEQHPETVCVIQSAFALESEKKRALEGGASAYLTKPIGANQLIEVLEKFLLKSGKEE